MKYTHRSVDGKDIVPIMETIIKNGGQCKLKVTGNSMMPFLKHLRDSVILVSPDVRPVKKGEIVFIKRDTGQYVLHRVCRIVDENNFIMNGDAQQWTEKVKNNQVIGVCKSIVKEDIEISCDNLLYRFVIKGWQILMPVRHYILKVLGFMKRPIK